MIVRIITYERSTLVNDEKYIGLDVHQATISVAVMMEPRKTNPGARHQISVFHNQGLDVADISPPSARGRSIFLTSPFIDQAISRFDILPTLAHCCSPFSVSPTLRARARGGLLAFRQDRRDGWQARETLRWERLWR